MNSPFQLLMSLGADRDRKLIELLQSTGVYNVMKGGKELTDTTIMIEVGVSATLVIDLHAQRISVGLTNGDKLKLREGSYNGKPGKALVRLLESCA